MPENLLLPKFLTKEIAEVAMQTAADAVLLPNHMRNRFKRAAFHIAVLVPAMRMDSAEYPKYPIEPHLIAELSFGDLVRARWPYDFAEIAKCKALQRWHDRNDGGTDIMPHVLFPRDTPFWGSVKRGNIVAACSGVQPYFDRMIASMTADLCIALAYDEWMNSPDKADDELCFLT